MAMYHQKIKEWKTNNVDIIAPDFSLSSRRNAGHIASYVTEVATLKTDKKTSKMGVIYCGLP